jgi:CheY-like chemotaxis protein
MARILVIDDDPTIRSLLSSLLDAAGHVTTTAQDGVVGMALFSRQRFDLVVTDIIMPEEEGIGTISAIRRLDREIPILAISANQQSGHQNDYLRVAEMLGATASLRKPIAPALFLETVARLLRKDG